MANTKTGENVLLHDSIVHTIYDSAGAEETLDIIMTLKAHGVRLTPEAAAFSLSLLDEVVKVRAEITAAIETLEKVLAMGENRHTWKLGGTIRTVNLLSVLRTARKVV